MSAAMYRALYAYAWDLADEGLEVALGRMRASGVNAITLAAAYHAGKFLRPHGRAGRVYFPADGTVYFRARPERYGHVKPVVNPLVEELDAFAKLARAAPDLQRHAWVVCCHNTRLGERHPDLAVQNAFGDRYPYSLCPAHPAVRDYVVNLCSDLAHHYDLAGLVLETPGWLPYDHGFHHEFAMVPLDRFARTLLALDFAPATLAAAGAVGVDAARLKARTRTLIEEHLACGAILADQEADERWAAEMEAEPVWRTFLDWRAELVANLVGNVRTVLPVDVALAVIPTVQQPVAAGWLEGSDLRLLASRADALEVPIYQPSAADAGREAAAVRALAGEATALRFILRPAHPDLGGGRETADAARAVQEVGMAGIAFYNYGLMPLSSLAHVEAALAALGAT